MSFEPVAWAFRQDLDPSAKLILVVLGEASNVTNEYACWLKHQTIAERAGVSRSTVQRKLNDLEAAGLVTIEERVRKVGGQSANLYRLPQEAWGPDAVHQADAPTASTGDAPTASPVTHPIEPEEELEEKNNVLNEEWNEYLAHYHEVTGNTSVRGSKTARQMFGARRGEGRSLEDLKLATVGVYNDEWKRENGWCVPDTLLKPSHIDTYIVLGQKHAPAPDEEEFDADAEHERDLKALHGE